MYSKISERRFLRRVRQLTKRIEWLGRERSQLEKELRYWQVFHRGDYYEYPSASDITTK
jgi:hypothetical protein